LSEHYFVSDAHLGAAPPESEARLLRFLETLHGRADSLYIVGDLFDFWFEYGRAIPKHGFRVLAELARLKKEGTRIVYVAGNHDFRFRDFFGRELGIETAESVSHVVDGLRVWVGHGDDIDQRFMSRLFRRLMRSRLNNFLYSFVHPDIGIGFANWVARQSRARGPDDQLRGRMARVAEARLAEGYDLVVMGHLHVPERRELDNGLYLNTGDWLTHFSYGVLRDGTVALERHTE